MHVFVQLLADLWKLNMCENHRINIKHETSQNNKNMGRSIVNSNHGNNEKIIEAYFILQNIKHG